MIVFDTNRQITDFGFKRDTSVSFRILFLTEHVLRGWQKKTLLWRS